MNNVSGKRSVGMMIREVAALPPLPPPPSGLADPPLPPPPPPDPMATIITILACAGRLHVCHVDVSPDALNTSHDNADPRCGRLT
jgi:hypothetical protein